jgi:hypothetical protein
VQHVDTPTCNLTYQGDGDTVGDLRCQRVEPGLVVSWWRPDRDELALLNAGGLVQLAIHTEPIPPVALAVAPDPDETLPVLGLAIPVPDSTTLDELLDTTTRRVRELWEQRRG